MGLAFCPPLLNNQLYINEGSKTYISLKKFRVQSSRYELEIEDDCAIIFDKCIMFDNGMIILITVW